MPKSVLFILAHNRHWPAQVGAYANKENLHQICWGGGWGGGISNGKKNILVTIVICVSLQRSGCITVHASSVCCSGTRRDAVHVRPAPGYVYVPIL